MKKFFYWFLSLTWGLPMTLIGFIVALVLFVTGHKPHKFGYTFYFKVGKNWGGLELGAIFLTDSTPSEHTLCHEHGHGLQNIIFGPLMPFVVCIPSAVRYGLFDCDTDKDKIKFLSIFCSLFSLAFFLF